RVDAAELGRGGYVLREAAAGTKTPVTLIATGSEVWLAMDAAKLLDQSGIAARVVSMPAPQLFLQQDAGWREAVLPRGGRFVSVAGWNCRHECQNSCELRTNSSRVPRRAPATHAPSSFHAERVSASRSTCCTVSRANVSTRPPAVRPRAVNDAPSAPSHRTIG